MPGREPAASVARLGAAARAIRKAADRSRFSGGGVAERLSVWPAPPSSDVGRARAVGVVLRLGSRCGELHDRARACVESRVGPHGPRRGVRVDRAGGTRAHEHPDWTATACGRMARSPMAVAKALELWSI